MANIHVRDVGILLVTKICGEEVHVKRLDVAAPSSGQHGLESTIALAVTFKRNDLLPKSKKQKNNKQQTTVQNVDTEYGINAEPVPCPDYP
jgi:hypothetical protein